MVDKDRISLTIRTQDKADASTWGVEMLHISVSFEPQRLNITMNIELNKRKDILQMVTVGYYSLQQYSNVCVKSAIYKYYL